jgi:hypothetical protein
MGARGSQHEQDEVTWETKGLKLGLVGLDLRQPSDAQSLSKLLNARFLDEKNVQRRSGYVGTRLIDGSNYPQYLTNPGDVPVTVPMAYGNWLYGFGQQLLPGNAQWQGDEHVPPAGRGQGTFQFNGENVAWTGDRILVVRDGGRALGSSVKWSDNGTTVKPYGIPAYLPNQKDTAPADAVAGNEVQTCLTATLRFLVATPAAGGPVAWVTDRASGALVSKATVGASTTPADVRLFNSGSVHGLHVARLEQLDALPVGLERVRMEHPFYG